MRLSVEFADQPPYHFVHWTLMCQSRPRKLELHCDRQRSLWPHHRPAWRQFVSPSLVAEQLTGKHREDTGQPSGDLQPASKQEYLYNANKLSVTTCNDQRCSQMLSQWLFIHVTWRALDQSRSRISDGDITINHVKKTAQVPEQQFPSSWSPKWKETSEEWWTALDGSRAYATSWRLDRASAASSQHSPSTSQEPPNTARHVQHSESFWHQ